MNVLLIGGSSSLMDEFIVKYKQEGHRIFLLTGDSINKSTYKRVFEKYDFEYETNNLDMIFESINPNLTVILGAYDTNYKWNNVHQDSVHFISGLMNILTSLNRFKNNRILFLSTNNIYNGYHSQRLIEDICIKTSNDYSNCIIQAEKLCADFKNNYDMDILILRLEGIIGLYKNRNEMNSLFSNICIQALKENKVHVNENHEITLMSNQEAVNAIYKISTNKDHLYTVYNISADNIINEAQLALNINKYLKNKIAIIIEKEEAEKCILSNERIKSEFNIEIEGISQKDIHDYVRNIEKRKNILIEDNTISIQAKGKLKLLLKMIFPFIENMICFIPFFMMNNRTVGSQYFANLDPYLLYVLLFAIVYGQQQATFSAILAVIGYMFRQMYTRTGFQVAIDYNTYVWIAQLFILGLVVGYMRDQIKLIQSESKEMEKNLICQINEIKEINETNVRIKNDYEKQIIEQKNSIGTIYTLTSILNDNIPEKVIFNAVWLLKEILGTGSIAIYTVNSQYAYLTAASSLEAAKLGTKVEYKKQEVLYDVITKGDVFINKDMDTCLPMIASGISTNQKLSLIIMIWGLDMEHLSLSQSNYYKVVINMIQDAYSRAIDYTKALENKRYISGTKILKEDSFKELIKVYRDAKKKNLASSLLMSISVSDNNYSTLSQYLLEDGYLGILKPYGLCLLLINKTEEDIKMLQNNLFNKGYRSQIVEGEIL